MDSPVREPAAAQRLLGGRYWIEQLLGAGGMAAVWRGRDLRLDRPVAIKELAGEGLRQPMALERFDREARAVGRLSHPNVVSVYDVGSQDGRPYLVMELVDGPTVAKLMESGPLPVADVLSIGSQVCDGLAAAHEAGIVHRDIKPANLIVTAGGVVKICDFGVARLLDASTSANANLTGPAMALGSPNYMAPEQISAGPIDRRTDLYALGCTMYAMLAGAPPFTGGGMLGILQQHVAQTPEPVRMHRPDVPLQIEALIADLLAKRPDQRPPDARVVRERIAAVQTDSALAAARSALLRSAAPPAETLSDDVPPGRPNRGSPTSTTRFRRWAVAAAAAVAIGVAGTTTALAALRTDTAPGAGPFLGPSASTAASPAPSALVSPTAARSTRTSASAKPHTHAPVRSTPTSPSPQVDPITAFRQAIAQEVTAGALQAPAATDLNHMVDDLVKTIATGNAGDVTTKINALRAKLTNLNKGLQLSDAGYQVLTNALDRVAADEVIPSKSA